MDKNEMTEKIRKLEAEQQIKEANSNQFGGSSMMQMGWQFVSEIDYKFGKMEKEIDGLKSANQEVVQAFEESKEEMTKMKDAFSGLKEEFEKTAGENAGLKEKMDKMNEEFVGKNVKMDEMEKKMKEIEAKHAELEGQIVQKNGEMAKMKTAKNEEKAKLEEEVKKLSKENNGLKEKMAKFAEMNVKLEEEMGKIKEEFSVKNNEFEGKMRESLEQKEDKEMVGNLIGRIEGMDFIQLNNKWNAADCGPGLVISEDGFVVTQSGSYRENSIRAVSPISPFNLNSTKPSIAGYFEVQIITQKLDFDIGFCTQQFPLKDKWLGDAKNSIGILCDYGMEIDGQTKDFENNAGGYFKVEDVVGLGIIHFPRNSPMKCFATLNGRLLGTVELPDNFSSLQLFPAVTLFNADDSIRANFGMETFLFDASQLLK